MIKSLDSVLHLEEIVTKLLSKEGCPWDREQTHASLKHYLIEETYEFLEAVEENNTDKMEEELGDLLFHIVFHSQIAKNNNTFTLESVAKRVAEKMVRRHPHVFGEKATISVDEVWKNWDQIKQAEKGASTKRETLLSAVPKQLPALLRAEKLQKRASRAGFDWDNIGPVWEKILEEFSELRDATTTNNKLDMQEELGDLIFSIVNLARKLDIDPEEALHGTNKKFIQRFTHIEDSLALQGKAMEEATLAEMDHLWNEAKSNGLKDK